MTTQRLLHSPRAALAAFALALALAACTSTAVAPADSVVLDRLYFGRSMPGDRTVSDDEWKSFLSESVTPRFPEGLTFWRADGQWRDAAGRITPESSYVLEIVHIDSDASERSIDAIRSDYRRRFDQESVLRVRAAVRVQL
jgi:hypothetical protein